MLNYPASYDGVISVAALEKNNELASFSQRNSRVDLAAPGVNILSTLPNAGNSFDGQSMYGSWSGTSMACPHVFAVAALLWGVVQNSGAVDIRNAMQETAEDFGAAGRDDYFGHGLVSAKKAYDTLRCYTHLMKDPIDAGGRDGATIGSIAVGSQLAATPLVGTATAGDPDTVNPVQGTAVGFGTAQSVGAVEVAVPSAVSTGFEMGH